ncbi:MAG: sterol desaturase family protein [Deltaproteobacteria bacterium]|nr:sterol desaturase family protein [Deltaproteobacteria bacterium]
MSVPLIVVAFAIVMIIVERRWPGHRLEAVRGWLPRVAVLNGVQALVVLASGWLVDPWLAHVRPWSSARLGVVGGAVLGYVALTFVYYWWHRARHSVPWLWRWVHQVHHSPARLEVVTSFYKHPLEIGLNGLLSAAVLYVGVGATPRAAAGAVLLSGVAELFYHWNVRTPRWVGYVFQRPEMHRVHHERGRHAHNYSDLPLWDMMFGTYENRATFDGDCGFEQDREQRLGAMLCGVDVNASPLRAVERRRTAGDQRAAAVVLGLGLVHMGARAAGLPLLAGAAAATGASPAPKVFTATAGYEAFSTRFSLRLTTHDGHTTVIDLDPETYSRLGGSYNRRNAYGAALAFWPVARDDHRLRPMFEAVARYGLCGERPLLQELGVSTADIVDPVVVVYEPRPGTTEQPAMAMAMKVQCS